MGLKSVTQKPLRKQRFLLLMSVRNWYWLLQNKFSIPDSFMLILIQETVNWAQISPFCSSPIFLKCAFPLLYSLSSSEFEWKGSSGPSRSRTVRRTDSSSSHLVVHVMEIDCDERSHRNEEIRCRTRCQW